MKKFICAAVAAVCAASAFAFGGCSVGEAHVEYTLSEDSTYYIVSGVSGDKRGLSQFTIPATYSAEEGGQALPVKEIGEMAFYRCSSLTNVTIPDSVIVIGKNAFSYCGLVELVIPESVTTIGYGAFGACDYLTEVTVPASVTELSPLAFAYCTKLETAYVKAEITSLTERVFYNSVASHAGNIYTSTSLTVVYLPATLKKIHKEALGGNRITDIYFAGSVEQWNNLYFYEMIAKEDNKDEFEEKVCPKDEAIPSSTTVHFNVQF